jgi:tRNA (cmo5U34)-methyltransferase
MARVGDDIETENAGWSFAGNVAERFDEHVARSVPFYREVHELIARTSDFFLSEGSVCYDLG